MRSTCRLLPLIVGVTLAGLCTGALGAVAPTPTPNWLQAETVPVPVAGGVNPNRPALALLPSNTVIAVAVLPGGIADLARRATTTGLWTRTAAGLTADPATFIQPVLAVAGSGEVIAVWHGPAGITTATRAVDGTWSAAEVISLLGATIRDVEVNRSGGAVVLYQQGTALRTRTRTGPTGAWSSEGLVANGPNVALGSAAVSNTGGVDVVFADGAAPAGALPKYSIGTLASNTWSAPADLPGHAVGAGAGRMEVRADGEGGAYAVWLRVHCEVLTAVRDPGSAVWISATPPSLTTLGCSAAGFNQLSYDQNEVNRGILAASVDEGPGPDGWFAGTRSASSPLAVLSGLSFPVGNSDGRHTIGAPWVTVTPNGSGYVGLTGSSDLAQTASTAVAMTAVSATGAVRNGFISASRAPNNKMTGLHSLLPPPSPGLVADALNRVNTAMVEWTAADLASTTNRLRMALRPGAGIRITGLTRRNAAGRIAARVVLSQPARVTVTFTSAGGRRIGQVVRNVPAGATIVRLPSAAARAASLFRVRVVAVNGGARATRTG